MGRDLVPASCQYAAFYGNEPCPPLLAHFLERKPGPEGPEGGSLISFLRSGVVLLYSSGASVLHTALAPALRSRRRVRCRLWRVLVRAVHPLEQGTALSETVVRKP